MSTVSLPPLLLQRLQKRGIITEKSEAADAEEVFAESYDNEDDTKPEISKEKYRGGAPGCPNKNIPYHICSDFCFDHWQEGYPESRLSERYLEQRKKMLRNYPLPKDWIEVYDPGMRRHYYWNQMTDEVSWLSPKHPKAVISEAAPKIARELWNMEGAATGFPTAGRRRVGEEEAVDNNRQGRERRDDRRGSDRERRGGRDHREERERHRGRDKRVKVVEADGSDEDGDSRPITELSDHQRLKRAKRRGIDPMDPSAYGEAPEGSWTSGLREDQEVKTGVDVTVAGPLFQQRPYPAPGAILRKQNPDKYPPQ